MIGGSTRRIPRAPAGAMARQMLLVGECPDMILDRVAARSRRLDRLGDRHPTALARQFQNPDGQLWQIAQKDAFALDLPFQGPFLLLQRPYEERQPWSPVRLGGPYRTLGSPQRQVVALLVPLDDTLKRAVGHIGIAGPQKE